MVTYNTTSSQHVIFTLGGCLLFIVVCQLLSGVLLSTHYVADWELSFGVTTFLLHDIDCGLLLRLIHQAGASLLFSVVWAHYWRSASLNCVATQVVNLWRSGFSACYCFMAISFLGYILPWGGMSFWALTVICNLLTVLPGIGLSCLYYCWGAFYITSSVLRRFFSLHYCLPFVVLLLALLHLASLHAHGSSSGGSCQPSHSSLDHFIGYYFKDLWFLTWYSLIVFLLLGCWCDSVGHSLQFTCVDRGVTPDHIVPEWYFLPFYAILRACSSKSLGVVLLVFSVLQLITSVHTFSCWRVSCYSAIDCCASSLVIFLLLLLAVVGSGPPFFPWLDLASILVLMFFLVA
jgi:quinol-cytochrome oxidoreductase complex cytochrome b subunit